MLSGPQRPLRRALIALGLSVAATLAVTSQASAQTPIKFRFNLGWKVEASGAGFLLAQQRGYYAAEGLDVTIDTGNGSSGAISAVASNTYDAASADIGTLIEFNINNPDRRLLAAAIQYDLNPNAIIVKKGGSVSKPADLAGKHIVGQPFNASRKLFPVFAKAQGIDPASVSWENIEPGIGDIRFIKGDYDGVAYFFFTGVINLKGKGLPPEQQVVFRYSDLGLKGYGNAIVVSAKVVTENPQAVAAFIKASTRGWIEAIADPKAGAAAVKAREPLADEGLELERLKLIVDGTMKTADVRANGWGAATPERLQATIDETVAAFGLKSTLAVKDFWTERFLPTKAVRTLK